MVGLREAGLRGKCLSGAGYESVFRQNFLLLLFLFLIFGKDYAVFEMVARFVGQ